jgi:long-chain acyl-CoA synthetase
MGFWYNMQLSLANKLIFSKWREALGNNILCIVSGGAAAQVRLIRIFTAAGIPVMEGYGLTETSPVISVNRYEVQDRMFGTVGPLLPGVEVKIAEDGEILCKGPNITLGYYKRPDLTAEAIVDGWFHTGDIGQLVDERFLKITDRKKEMFKTSGGKYVAPLVIENKLKESMLVEQIMIVGPERKFVSALIVPSFANLRDWSRKNGIPDGTNEELIRNPKVVEHYHEIVESYNKYFNHVEQIKRFELLPAEWSIETGEMTPKLSLKRKVITEKYRSLIDHIYRQS